MRNYSHLLNCSTVIFMGDWGAEGLLLIAEGVLAEQENNGYTEGAAAEKGLVLTHGPAIKQAMVSIY